MEGGRDINRNKTNWVQKIYTFPEDTFVMIEILNVPVQIQQQTHKKYFMESKQTIPFYNRFPD